MRWREPTHGSERCPKCSARLVVTPVEDRCPYCDYSKYKGLPPREREDDGVLPSLENNIQAAIADADVRAQGGPAVVSYELPRELNFERYAISGLAGLLYITLRFAIPGRRYMFGRLLSEPGGEYLFWGIVVPTILVLLTTWSTFVTPRLILIAYGLLSALAAGWLLLNPGLVLQHVPPSLPLWAAKAVLGYQVLFGLWSATLLWREYRALTGR
jgi:hypothetical protein